MSENETIRERDLPRLNPGPRAFLRAVQDGRSYRVDLPEVTSAAAALADELDGLVAAAQADIAPLISGLGYLPPVAYAPGILVDSSRVTVSSGDIVYAPVQSAIPFTTGAVFDPDQWRVVQGVVADDLASPTGAGMVRYQQPAAGSVDRPISEKFKETLSILEFTGDTTSKVQAAVDGAAAQRGRVTVPAGRYDVASLDNPGGVKIVGDGIVVHAPSANSEQYRILNPYGDDVGYDCGREYLAAFHSTLYAFNRPKVYLYGDSTVEGFGATAPFRPQDVLDAAFFAQGLATFEIANYGVSGQASNEFDPAAAVADANCRLLIVSYGINDGSWGTPGDDLELFYTNMSSQLAAIRATRGVDTLSICIKSSNSTNDWANGRHQVWHERLNGVYKQLAREFRCFFFDTYARWSDSQGAAVWMDTIAYGGQDAHIHPNNLGNMWIWGELAAALVPSSLSQRMYNGFRNVRDDYAPLSVNVAPSSLPYGISMHRATPTGGFPLDGACITMKQADGVATQRVVRFGSSLPVSCVRHAVSGSAWSAFTAEKNAITLLNGWSNYDASQFAAAAYHINENGEVALEGLIKPTGAIDADPLFTLPAWVRPTRNRIFELSCDTGRCQVVLLPDGNLQPITYSGTPAFVSLESVRFKP